MQPFIMFVLWSCRAPYNPTAPGPHLACSDSNASRSTCQQRGKRTERGSGGKVAQQAKDAAGGKKDEFEQSGEKRVRIIKRVKQSVSGGREERQGRTAQQKGVEQVGRSLAPSRREPRNAGRQQAQTDWLVEMKTDLPANQSKKWPGRKT
ncbi:hypothetical protein E2C01_070514 [Portunus trituberculatus]|uniref:Uncharacterized protein n=1 Tax=Portunus trituberculatus TaxID=210409 RepID=A0A5B7I2H5_PORTR|nr:hypothetical protein [Portunus trituberculatus]